MCKNTLHNISKCLLRYTKYIIFAVKKFYLIFITFYAVFASYFSFSTRDSVCGPCVCGMPVGPD